MDKEKKQLCIFICNNFAAEAAAILHSGHYPDVKLKTYASSCYGPVLDSVKIAALIEQAEHRFSKLLFIASSCRPVIDKKETTTGTHIEIVFLEQCFELILNKELVYHFIKQGYYLISSGWLNNYKQHIREWGFDEKQAKEFFSQSIQKILFLDTGIDADYHTKLQYVSQYMGLPYDVLPVGLTYCRNFIDAKVSAWRAENERIQLNDRIAAITRESADFNLVFRQLQKLVDFVDETAIVNELFRLIDIMFAARQIGYLKRNNGSDDQTRWYHASEKTETACADENCFNIEVTHQNQVIGVFKIYGIRFPEYMIQYRQMIPVIGKIGGISIANARKYEVISKQKVLLSNSELKYKNLSNQLTAILDHIPGLVFYKDRNNNFIRVNRYVAEAYKKSKEELEGKNLNEFYSSEEAEKYYEDDLQVINSGEAKINIIEPWQTNLGLKWVSTSKIPFIDDRGEIIGVIGISLDITDLKNADDEIRVKNEQLRNLNSEKDKFFSIIAHDLKSPFNSIVGFSDLLVEKIDAGAFKDAKRYATIILNSSERAVELLSNLMDWSRSQTGRMEFTPEPVEMTSFISEIIQFYHSIATQKSIHIGQNFKSEINIFADKAMVGTVMRNLISNAIKFTNNGGKITVSAEEKQHEVVISVKDNGVGISGDVASKLFRIDENITTRGTNNEKGTGLGLILCKEFIEKHGGRIWVESEPGQGSAFSFSLPL